MENKSVKQMMLGGAFIAFGIVLPMMFHAFGLGSTFLPMHIPVLLSGFFLEPVVALVVGAVTPFLSSVFTGMPPIFPMMPIMVFELAAYGFVVSIVSKKVRNPFIPLITSMITGRIVAGAVVWVLGSLFAANLPGPGLFIVGAITKGVPGILIQLFFIPATVILIEKAALNLKGEKSIG